MSLPPPARPPRKPGAGPVRALSGMLGRLRWLFLPAGLLCLLAVGVHAAADTLDDRVAAGLDALDALLDGFLARQAFTERLVRVVEPGDTARVARGLAFLWELAADLVVALPALGYAEPAPATSAAARGLRALLRRAFGRPTLLRLTRPVFAGALALAGACTVARLAQGECHLALHGLGLPAAWSGGAARAAALGALALVLATLGWRAVLGSLEHADRASEAALLRGRRGLVAGLRGTVVVLPLALAAALDAAPLLSFVR